jgi:3-dehydroquinate synthase class II
MLLAEEEGSLVLKVKHFSADFTAWEDKEDYVTFRLVRVEPGAVHFSGISFYSVSDDEIHTYLALHDGDKVWEEKLVYRRVEP